MARIFISAANQAEARDWQTTLAAGHDIYLFINLQQALEEASLSAPALIIADEDSILPHLPTLSAEIHNPVKLMVIGRDWTEQQQIQAMISGCSGYCENKDTLKQLPKAVHHILKGEIWIQRHLVPQVIKVLAQKNRTQQVLDILNSDRISPKLDLLSSREQEVAKLVTKGESNKQIAAELKISERTVKAHLTSVFSKLDIPDRLHLAILLKENTLSS